jgi:hypothetical protein
MKRLISAAAAVMIVLTMAGCSGTNAKDTEKKSSSAESTAESKGDKAEDKKSEDKDTDDKGSTSQDLPEAEPAKGIATISIVTDDAGASDSLDFIKEPVARHVSELIASWTPGYQMPPEPFYKECGITLYDENAQVISDGLRGNVKVRGNWTTTYSKKPLRIKFDEKQSVMGLNGGAEMKNWLLLAEYKDGSMLRDKASLQMARGILGADKLYAADTQLVDVVVNGNYWGVYLLTEQQQVNPNRIDITDPEKDYQGTDIGYFMEFDGYFYNEDDLHQFRMDYNRNAALTPYDGNGGSGRTMQVLGNGSWDDPKEEVGMTIQSDIYSVEQHDFIANYTNNVYNIMYRAAYEDEAWVFDENYKTISLTDKITPREAVEKVVNVDSLADMYLISELTCDADIYWSSFFMDVDFGEGGDKKLTFEAPWDFDSGLGNKNRCADGTGYYAANIVPDVNGGPSGGGAYETINPWLAVLMYEDWFRDIISTKWKAAYDAGVFTDTLDTIENDKTKYKDAFERNYSRWDNLVHNDDFANELTAKARKCKTQEEAADYLHEWISARVDFMNGEWGS